MSIFFPVPISNKIGFDDIVHFILNKSTNQHIILINTLPIHQQQYLIQYTISCDVEEKVINDSLLSSLVKNQIIIIYGKNHTDNTMESKYNQLVKLGFLSTHLFIYYGGIFEWALLQDIYGDINFPTNSSPTDFMIFKPDIIIPKNTPSTTILPSTTLTSHPFFSSLFNPF